MSLKKIIATLFSSKLNKQFNNLNSGKSFDEKYSELGVFEYHDDEFTINFENVTKTLKWNEITQLNAYQEDLMTIDKVEMEIVYGDKYITITEDLPPRLVSICSKDKIYI